MKIKVIVSGAKGRLGSRILERLTKEPDFEVVARLIRGGAVASGFDTDLGVVIEEAKVLIETAPPAVALGHAEQAAARKVAVLIATTGFSSEERARLDRLKEHIPVLVAPNLSPGVAVVNDLVARASKALAAYDLELVELHHKRKRDAPSGTAWALAKSAASARGWEAEEDAVVARSGEVGPRGRREIGIQALRGGEVIGEHTVFFLGEHERVEITHRASSRDVFAEGAVRAARFLNGRAPGTYSMRDVLGL